MDGCSHSDCRVRRALQITSSRCTLLSVQCLIPYTDTHTNSLSLVLEIKGTQRNSRPRNISILSVSRAFFFSHATKYSALFSPSLVCSLTLLQFPSSCSCLTCLCLQTGELFRHRMLHLVSLLGATAILELQGASHSGCHITQWLYNIT